MSRITDWVIDQEQKGILIPEKAMPDPDIDWQNELKADPDFEKWLNCIDEKPF